MCSSVLKISFVRIFLSFVLQFLLITSLFAQVVAPKDDEQIDFANGLFGRDLFEMAATEYNNLLQKFPESPYAGEARFGLGESYFFLKDFEQAVTYYGQYIEFFPDGDKVSIANLRMGEGYFHLNDLNQALLSFLSIEEESLEENFRQRLYFYVGKVYQSKGDSSQAIEAFNKVVSINNTTEQSIIALFELGNVYLSSQHRREAIKFYQQVYEKSSDPNMKSLGLFKQGETYAFLEEYAQAIMSFEKVVSQYPKEKIARQSISSLLVVLFNDSQYLKVIESFNAYKPEIGDNSQIFTDSFIVANAYDQLGNYEKSLEVLDSLLNSESIPKDDYKNLFVKKIEILIKLSQFEKALSLIQEGLSQGLEQTDQFLFLQAESYFGQQQYDKSYALYTQILKDFPKSFFADDALYGMAHAQNLLGEENKSMELFFQYFSQGENQEKKQEALFNALLIAQKLGEINKAIEFANIYLERLKSAGHFKEVQITLGKLYSASQQYSKAIEIFQKYIALNKKDLNIDDAYFLLAYNLQLIGQIDLALENYEVIVFDEKRKSLYFSALKNEALIYISQGDEKKAIQLFVQIIEEFAENDLPLKTYLWVVGKLQENEQFAISMIVLNQAESRFKEHGLISGVYYFQGMGYQKLKQFRASIAKFEEVFAGKNQSYFAPSLLGKALSLSYLKEYGSAQEIFNQIILNYADDNTMSMRSRFELAYIEQENKNIEKAAKLYMLIAVLYRDDYYCPESLLRAGSLFEQLDKKKEALKVYEEILQEYPSSHAVNEARGKIEQLKAL